MISVVRWTEVDGGGNAGLGVGGEKFTKRNLAI
jgi:hypothetical protein